MNKILLTNGAWLLVSAAAFAIGGKVMSSKSDGDQPAPERSSRLTAMPDKQIEDAGKNGKSRDTDLPSEYRQSLETLANGGDPKAFVQAFLNEGDALEANKMFADLLLNLTADNAREIFDALREGGGADGNFGRDMGLFLQAWGRLDGLKAIEAVADLGGDGRRRAFGSMSAMEGWASSDSDAAKAYVANAEAGWEKGMMSQGLISGIARMDPGAATEYVLELEAERQASGESGDDDRWRGFAVDRQMQVIAEAQMRRGPGEATSWAEDLPEGDLKAAAFDQVAENYVKNDPAAAAKWVEEHASSDYAQRAVREIAEEFGRSDPEAAIAWAENLPEESQGNALAETLDQWTRSDPVEASKYLQDMEESPARDAAVQSFARQLDREDPAAAADWAVTISDEGKRTETLQSVGSSWMRTDPEGAKAWLPSSGLTPEAQQKIIEQPSGRGGDWGRRR
ncbi:MAG: hypothetical protein ACR2RV_19240 [Verrucomicrobiales bacterium]